MEKSVYNKTRENVAKLLGREHLSDLSGLTETERAEMIANARKKMRINCRIKVQNLYSGNPYVMLNRKVNSKGKPTN